MPHPHPDNTPRVQCTPLSPTYLEVGFARGVRRRVELALEVALTQLEQPGKLARHPVRHILDEQHYRRRGRLR